MGTGRNTPIGKKVKTPWEKQRKGTRGRGRLRETG